MNNFARLPTNLPHVIRLSSVDSPVTFKSLYHVAQLCTLAPIPALLCEDLNDRPGHHNRFFIKSRQKALDNAFQVPLTSGWWLCGRKTTDHVQNAFFCLFEPVKGVERVHRCQERFPRTRDA